MAQAAESFINELSVDASKAEAGVRTYETAIGRAAAASGKLKAVEGEAAAAIEKTTGAQRIAIKQTEQAERALARYVDRFDPAIRAQQELARAETAVETAKRRGIAVTEQQIATVEKLREKTEALKAAQSGSQASAAAAAAQKAAQDEQAALAKTTAAWDAAVREREANAAMIIAYERSIAEAAQKTADVQQRAAAERASAAARMAQEAAAESERVVAAYARVTAGLDPAIKRQQAYEAALADVVAYHRTVGSSSQALAADMDRVRAALSPAALAAKDEAEAVEKLGLKARALTESLDPAIKRQRVFRESLADADAMLAKGLITYEQHAIAAKRYHDTMKGTDAATTATASSMGGLRGVMGNLGYQFQDIAVQAQMGTSAFVIFAQQGSQIASAFGPVGAIIGAVIAVAGAAGMAVAGMGKAADSAATAYTDYGKALEIANKFADAANSASSTRTAALEAERRSVIAVREEILNKLQAEILDAEASADALKNQPDMGPAQGAYARSADVLREKYKGLRQEIEILKGSFGVYNDGARDVVTRTAASGQATTDYAANIRSLNDGLREQISQLGFQVEAQDLSNAAKLRAKLQSEAMAKSGVAEYAAVNSGTRALIDQAVARQEQVDAMEEAAKAAKKAETAAAREENAYEKVADALDRDVEAQKRLAEIAGLGAAEQRAANEQTRIAAELAKAHASESSAEGRAIAAKVREAERWKAVAADTQTLNAAKANLKYAQDELALNNLLPGARERAVRSLQIQREATERWGAAASDVKTEWIGLQERIADTQAVKKFEDDVRDVAKGIGRDVSENLWDQFTGEAKAQDALTVFKNLFKRIAIEALNANIILPITTSVVGAVPGLFGISSPTTGASAAAGQAAGQSVGGGLTGQLTNTAISKGMSWGADKLGITGSITNAVDGFGYSALGIGTLAGTQGTMMTTAAGGLAQSAGVMPTLGGVSNAAAAGSTTVGGVTGGLSVYLGAAGAGALGGGLVGGALGTATNSKVVGGLSGAAAGAGTAYLASIMGMGAMGGPVGLAIAAVVGGIMGMLGTQKASVGPIGAATVNAQAGWNPTVVGSASDNGGDAGPPKQAADAAAAAIKAVYAQYGGTTGQGLGNNPGIWTQDQKFWVGLGKGTADEKVGGFDNAGDAAGAFVKLWLTKVSTGVSEDILTAIRHTTANDIEELSKTIDFAGGFKKNYYAMLNGVDPVKGQEESIRKAAEDNGKAWKDFVTEFKTKAVDLNLATKDQANGALRAFLDTVMGLTEAKPALTDVQVAYRQQIALFESLRASLTDVGGGAEYASGKINEATQKYRQKVAGDFNSQLDAQINEATGRGWVNQAAAIQQAYQANMATATEIGGDLTRVGTLYAAQVQGIIDQNQLAGASFDELIGRYPELRGQIHAYAEALDTQAEALRAATQAAAMEDLAVRALRAQGRTAEADALALQLQQQREYAEAVTARYDAAGLAEVQRVQGLERARAATEAATAATEAATKASAEAAAAIAAQAAASEDLAVRRLRAEGATAEADALALRLQHQRDYEQAAAAGRSAGYLAELTAVQALEDAAQAAQTASEALATAATAATTALSGLSDSLATAAQSVLDAHRQLALVPVAATARALGTLGVEVTGPRIALLGAGVDPNERPGLTVDLLAYNAKALAGTLTGPDLIGGITRLKTALDNGRLAPDQYAAMVDWVTARFVAAQKALLATAQETAARANAARQGLLGVREALGGGQRQAGQLLLDQGLDPTVLPDLTAKLNGFLTVARAGTATADDYAGAALRVTTALNAKTINEQQYTALLGDLATAYQAVTERTTATVAALKELASGIRTTLQELEFSDRSILSPEAQVQAAKTALETAVTEAGKGDAKAADRVQGLLQTFLEKSQAVNANDGTYAADYRYGTGLLSGLADKIDAAETPAQKTATATALSAEMLGRLNTAITTARTDQIEALGQIEAAQKLMTAGQDAVRTLLATDVSSALTRLAATANDNPISAPIVAAITALRTDSLAALALIAANGNAKPTALQGAITGTDAQLASQYGGSAETMLTLSNGATISQSRRNALARELGYTGDFGNGALQAYMTANTAWANQFLAAAQLAASPARALLAPVVGAHRLGGIVGGDQTGGYVGNGLYDVDSVRARYAGGGDILLAGGEHVTRAAAVNARTSAMLDHINRHGDLPALPANDRPAANVVTFRPRLPSGGDLSALVAQVATLTDEVKKLRAERARDARGQAALTEEAIGVNAAGHQRTSSALRRQENKERAA